MMTQSKLLALATALGALVGSCASSAPDPAAGGDPTSRSGLSSPATIELRLIGDDAGSLTQVTARVATIAVEVDGASVTPTLTGTTANLADTTQAWQVGSFVLPAGAVDARITIALDASGAYTGSTGSGTVDYRGAPMVFDVSAENLAARGKMVVHTDLSRSLVSVGSGQLLHLPQLHVAF